MRKYLLLPLFFIALLTVFSASGQKYVQPRQTLKISLAYPPRTADPRTSTDPVSTTFYLMLFEGLFRLDEEGNAQKALVRDYEVSDDRTVYTFHLKKSLFSDGSHLTAYDFERSWKTAVSPEFASRASELLLCIKNAKKQLEGKGDTLGVEAIDDLQLKVTLEAPTPYFLQLLAFPTFFPVHSSMDSQKTSLIGNGPFALTSDLNSSTIHLEKNPYFHEHNLVHLNQIELAIIPDGMTAFYLFRQEKNHWFGGFFQPLPFDSTDEILSNYELKERATNGLCFSCVNLKNPLLSNLNVRKAIYSAMEPQILAKQFPVIVSQQAHGITPTTFWKQNNIYHTPCTGNVHSKQLFEQGLTELGMSPGQLPSLTLIYQTNGFHKSMAELIQENLRINLGLSIKLVATCIPEHYVRLVNGNYDLSISAWIAQFHDPINYLARLSHLDCNKNYPRWENPSFTKLLEKSALTEDKTLRATFLHEAETILMQELPLMPLYHFNLTYLQHPKLKNVHISPLGLTDFRYAYFEKS